MGTHMLQRNACTSPFGWKGGLNFCGRLFKDIIAINAQSNLATISRSHRPLPLLGLQTTKPDVLRSGSRGSPLLESLLGNVRAASSAKGSRNVLQSTRKDDLGDALGNSEALRMLLRDNPWELYWKVWPAALLGSRACEWRCSAGGLKLVVMEVVVELVSRKGESTSGHSAEGGTFKWTATASSLACL
ncbi:hypothetical protein H4219_000494 [Mycoemilia scoparia]|uniref:Uncharacterized protein n=1 Tax=Mycoemilia scoparia TaxID=417184 RepID=A0A9W8DRJ8_9FUNG|nr:hypothetical protein H4219_000494 [Mycoemilia scoparia]